MNVKALMHLFLIMWKVLIIILKMLSHSPQNVDHYSNVSQNVDHSSENGHNVNNSSEKSQNADLCSENTQNVQQSSETAQNVEKMRSENVVVSHKNLADSFEDECVAIGRENTSLNIGTSDVDIFFQEYGVLNQIYDSIMMNEEVPIRSNADGGPVGTDGSTSGIIPAVDQNPSAMDIATVSAMDCGRECTRDDEMVVEASPGALVDDTDGTSDIQAVDRNHHAMDIPTDGTLDIAMDRATEFTTTSDMVVDAAAAAIVVGDLGDISTDTRNVDFPANTVCVLPSNPPRPDDITHIMRHPQDTDNPPQDTDNPPISDEVHAKGPKIVRPIYIQDFNNQVAEGTVLLYY